MEGEQLNLPPIQKTMDQQPNSTSAPASSRDGTDDTIPYTDDSDQTLDCSDIVVDDEHWSMLTQEQKICCNTGSFTVPRYIDGAPVSLDEVGSYSTCKMFYSVQTDRQRRSCLRTRSDLIEEYKGMTDDDRSYFTLYNIHSDFCYLVGKKRKEATQQEKRQMATSKAFASCAATSSSTER